MAFVGYIRRWVIKTDSAQIPAATQPWILKALNEGWGGVEMRYSFGESASLLDYCQPSWVLANVTKLMPSGDFPVGVATRRAFLSGYLFSRKFVIRNMRALATALRGVTDDFTTEHPPHLTERVLAELFLNHTAVGWIWDVEGYGMNDLMGLVISKSSEADRDHIVRWFGWEYQRNEDLRTRIWNKMNMYWANRVIEIGSLPVGVDRHEMSTFSWWIKHIEIPLSEIKERLILTIDYLRPENDGHELLDALAFRAERRTCHRC